MPIPVTFADYRERARRRLPKLLFDYIDGGSYAEATLARNVDDFDALCLRQRVLRDVAQLDTSIEIFGQKLAFPLILAPVGMAGLYARRGEVQATRAAALAGIPACLSTMSICALSEVAREAATPPWFQLYMMRDRGYMADLLQRARELACPALVFTVDLPVPGARYRDVRSGMFGARSPFAWLRTICDAGRHPAWLWDVWLNGRPSTFGNLTAVHAGNLQGFWGWIKANFDASVTWKDLDWVRSRWPGPLVLKGILDVDDAKLARSAGADGIVVSNHGGRQLDGVSSTIGALPAVAQAVGADMVVMIDGGIRSGLDLLKAMACGARAGLIGRPWAFALAAEGQKGVSALLATYRQELSTAMALTGCTRAREARQNLLDT